MRYLDFLHIIAEKQILYLYRNNAVVKSYSIATSRYGLGECQGSYKTPRGWHRVRAKIGAGQSINTVFVGRRPTGEIYTPQLAEQYPDRDWILTRILWLSGIELGKNRLGKVDTMQRYIYIHGTPDEVQFGIPNSHGCIRMHNEDLIELFDLITVGEKVLIT